MKKLAVLLAVLAFILTACTERTEFGECVGIGDDRDPKLVYKTSAGNVALAVIFIETIVVPIVVVFSEVSCPVGRRTP